MILFEHVFFAQLPSYCSDVLLYMIYTASGIAIVFGLEISQLINIRACVLPCFSADLSTGSIPSFANSSLASGLWAMTAIPFFSDKGLARVSCDEQFVAHVRNRSVRVQFK